MLLLLCSFTLGILRHVLYVMKKKTTIIIASVAAVFVLGLLSSIYFNWPVDRNSSDGDIAKSSHFLRKSAEERIDNMKELLQTDEAFRNNLLAANLVMHARAAQFSALVDMSNEVADGIPEYADVLKDMNAARPMIDNVRTILGDLLNALDGDLSGENPKDLTQGTINASLAYVKFQKQNSLADRFIATTDDYLNKKRIEFITKRLCEDPGLKQEALYFEAGYRSRQTAYRNFVKFTGCSPTEFLSNRSTGTRQLKP